MRDLIKKPWRSQDLNANDLLTVNKHFANILYIM